MTKRRSKIKTPQAPRFQKVLHLAVEGRVTEKQYFNHLKTLGDSVHFNFIETKNNGSPLHLKKCLENFLSKRTMTKREEAWIVSDVNSWERSHIEELVKFGKLNNVQIVLSNPRFEYWLLIHFQEVKKFQQNELNQSLRRHSAFRSKKEINSTVFTLDRIDDAIRRAKQSGASENIWPMHYPSTSVYKLVESALRRNLE